MEEKTGFQKAVTEWIFNQSVGIVISLLALGISEYRNSMLNKEVFELNQQMKEILLYQRDAMQKTLTENTRALETFKIYSDGKNAHLKRE